VNELQSKFSNIFQNYKEIYSNIFRQMYPANGSTGFTERNMTGNFSKAYERCNDGAATWFEFPFANKNTQHYDALIINPILQEILVIEAKRFSTITEKIHGVASDIERINSIQDSFLSDSRLKHLKSYSLYGIVLADIWSETKRKKAILRLFFESKFRAEYLMDIPPLNQETYFVKGFPEIEKQECIRNYYYLLSLIW